MATPIYYPGQVVRLEVLVRVNTTALAARAAAGATTLTVYDISGYGVGDTIVVEPSATPELAPQEILTLHAATAPSGHTLTLAAATAFDHPAGALVSELVAATVTATLRLPDGTTESPSVSAVSTGRYRVEYATVLTGRHVLEWAASGAATGAGAYAFVVAADQV